MGTDGGKTLTLSSFIESALAASHFAGGLLSALAGAAFMVAPEVMLHFGVETGGIKSFMLYLAGGAWLLFGTVIGVFSPLQQHKKFVQELALVIREAKKRPIEPPQRGHNQH